MTTASEQIQTFYAEGRKIADVNLLFLELVRQGLTREELATNIARRPALWQRFESWLGKLPTAAEARAAATAAGSAP